MSTLILFLVALMSMPFILALLLWLYRDYRTDVFRQKMFALRGDLFDEARLGRIAFDSDAYGMLRSTMNGFIRFGHRFSLTKTILFSMVLKKEHSTDPFSERLEQSLEGCTEAQKTMIRSYYLRMNLQMMEHLILSSVLLMVTIVIPLVFFASTKTYMEKQAKRFRTSLDTLDNFALTEGTTA